MPIVHPQWGFSTTTYQEMLEGFGGTLYFWPLNETTWNETPGEITDISGNSDGTYDRWDDPNEAGVSPYSLGGIAQLGGTSSGFLDNTAQAVSGYGIGGIDKFLLGNATWSGGGGTAMGWLMLTNPISGTVSGTGINLFSANRAMFTLFWKTDVSPHELGILNYTKVGDIEDFDGVPVFFAHVTNGSGTHTMYVFHGGSLQITASTPGWGGSGTLYLECDAAPGYGDPPNHTYSRYQNVAFIDGVMLSSAQLTDLYNKGING